MSSLVYFAALLVGLGNVLSRLGRGALSNALRHESVAYGKE